MSEESTKQRKRPARSGPERWVKLGFLAAAIILAVVVYSRGGTILAGWREQLPSALEQARREGRKLLVVFMSDPPSQTLRRLAATTLAKQHNADAIREGKFIRVKVKLDSSLKSETAGRHKIRSLPTTLILDANGVELNRREGMIGEVPFRDGFLDCGDVVKP